VFVEKRISNCKHIVLLYRIQDLTLRIVICEVNKIRFEKSPKKLRGFVVSYDIPTLLRSMLAIPS
jgi:hypothetical protein